MWILNRLAGIKRCAWQYDKNKETENMSQFNDQSTALINKFRRQYKLNSLWTLRLVDVTQNEMWYDTWYHTARCSTHIYNSNLFIQIHKSLACKGVLPVYFVQYYSTQKPGQRSANLPRLYSVGVRKRVKSTSAVEIQAWRENSPGCKS